MIRSLNVHRYAHTRPLFFRPCCTAVLYVFVAAVVAMPRDTPQRIHIIICPLGDQLCIYCTSMVPTMPARLQCDLLTYTRMKPHPLLTYTRMKPCSLTRKALSSPPPFCVASRSFDTKQRSPHTQISHLPSPFLSLKSLQ